MTRPAKLGTRCQGRFDQQLATQELQSDVEFDFFIVVVLRCPSMPGVDWDLGIERKRSTGRRLVRSQTRRGPMLWPGTQVMSAWADAGPSTGILESCSPVQPTT